LNAAQALRLSQRTPATATFTVKELTEGEIEMVITDGKGTHRDRVRLAPHGTLIEQAREEAKAKA
jgi:hypothetical protein